VLGDDQGFKFVGIQSVEIRKRRMRSNHAQSMPAINFRANQFSINSFYTAICGS
jgi:hypothetical protein